MMNAERFADAAFSAFRILHSAFFVLHYAFGASMPYVTLQQLKDRLGSSIYARLTDRVAGATPSDTVGQQIVDEAEAQADSFLATRYATPIDLSARPEVADILEARVLDLAEFLAWRGSPFVGDVPDRVRLVQDNALRWFESVVDGKTLLPAAAPPTSTTARTGAPQYSSADRVFTADELDGL
jgi:phage gp36-like protein